LQYPTFTDLDRLLSRARLDGYRRDGADTQTVTARYLWNVALSEALYPSLHVLEVALRNSLDRAVGTHLADHEWLVRREAGSPTSLLLDTRAQAMVAEACAKLEGAKKPVEQGRMVAELSFGFWTSLLNRRYDQGLWPAYLKSTFPGAPRTERTRSTFSKRFNAIREIRNRVSHHEPIWYRATLAVDHKDIIEACQWLEPSSILLLQQADRFSEVLAVRPG